MTDRIERLVKQAVGEILGTAEHEIGLEYHFERDGGADSLDKIEILMALEEEFELEVPDEDAEKIETVGQAVAWFAACAGQAAPPPAPTVGAKVTWCDCTSVCLGRSVDRGGIVRSQCQGLPTIERTPGRGVVQ